MVAFNDTDRTGKIRLAHNVFFSSHTAGLLNLPAPVHATAVDPLIALTNSVENFCR